MSGDALQSAAGAGPQAPGHSEQDQTPYLDAIVEYAERRPGRFHVPGHKGGHGADPAAIEALGQAAFDRDVPAGIEGIDVGPDSPFQRAQRLAAERLGRAAQLVPDQRRLAGKPRHLPRASPPGHAASSSSATPTRARSTGSSSPGWSRPSSRPSSTPSSASPTALPRRRSPRRSTAPRAPSPRSTVSPTYFGAVADVSGLSEVCHDRGLPLVVDEAWGSHLRFSPLLPASALECGADLVLSSVHKLLGSLTQSAILHLGQGGMIDEDVVDRCVTLTESTSPSALLTASLDADAPLRRGARGGACSPRPWRESSGPGPRFSGYPGSTSSTSGWSVARGSTAGIRCACRSTSAAPAAPAPGSPP